MAVVDGQDNDEGLGNQEYQQWPYGAGRAKWHEQPKVELYPEYVKKCRAKFASLGLMSTFIKYDAELKISEWYGKFTRGEFSNEGGENPDPDLSKYRYLVSWLDAWFDRNTKANTSYGERLVSWRKSLSRKEYSAIQWWTYHGDSIMNRLSVMPFLQTMSDRSEMAHDIDKDPLFEPDRESDTTDQIYVRYEPILDEKESAYETDRLITDNLLVQHAATPMSLVRQVIRHLQSALYRAPGTLEHIRLFRGVRMSWKMADAIAARAGTNNVIVSTSLQAFSRSPCVPLQFAPSVLFVLHVRRGFRVADLHLSRLSVLTEGEEPEWEVLLPAGALFRVIKAWRPSNEAFATFREIRATIPTTFEMASPPRMIRTPIIELEWVTPSEVEASKYRADEDMVLRPYYLPATKNATVRSSSGEDYKYDPDVQLQRLYRHHTRYRADVNVPHRRRSRGGGMSL